MLDFIATHKVALILAAAVALLLLRALRGGKGSGKGSGEGFALHRPDGGADESGWARGGVMTAQVPPGN